MSNCGYPKLLEDLVLKGIVSYQVVTMCSNQTQLSLHQMGTFIKDFVLIIQRGPRTAHVFSPQGQLATPRLQYTFLMTCRYNDQMDSLFYIMS